MKKSTWIFISGMAVIAIIAVVMIARTNNSTPDNSSDRTAVQVAVKSGIGGYLTDAAGRTLYYFPKDNIGRSNCYGGCAAAWPIFYAEEENMSVGEPLSLSDFGEIVRDDGSEQTTYKGWPLYYYQNDVNPGDTLGEGVGDIWYIMPEPFYTVMAQNKNAVGTYLTDAQAMAFYYFANDVQGTDGAAPASNCSGQCLASWPMVPAGQVIAPSLLKVSDFSSLVRAEGGSQLVYKGRPLYYYAGDNNPGDTNGHEFNNVWFLVKP